MWTAIGLTCILVLADVVIWATFHEMDGEGNVKRRDLRADVSSIVTIALVSVFFLLAVVVLAR